MSFSAWVQAKEANSYNEGGLGMKKYTKPAMAVTKFGSKDAFAAGSIYDYQFVTVDTTDPNGPVTVYQINSFSAAS